MHAAHHTVGRMRDARLFRRTRARLQRSTDTQSFNGWLLHLAIDEATIRLNHNIEDVKTGEVFSVEATGKESMAIFIGQVVAILDDRLTFRLTQGVATLPLTEDARISYFGEEGTMNVEGSNYPFTVVDISENGIGLRTLVEMPCGVVAQFEISPPYGVLTGEGEIRYCRPDPDSPDQFRVGMKVNHENRIQRARWMQLVATIWDS